MIRLHHSPQTRSMRVLWLLHELGVEFDVQIWTFDKALRSDDFLKLHPVGRVPALELDGQAFWESGAMIEALCERFPEAGLGRMPGDEDRAEWLNWVHFAETISQHAASLTQQHVMLYPPEVRSPVVIRLEPKRLARCYAALDQRLAGRDWLLDGFSAADVACGQAVYMARRFAKVEPFEALSDWCARIEARPAFQASLPKPGEHVLYAQDFYEPLP